MTHATNYEVQVIPTLAKGVIKFGPFLTASEAAGEARRIKKDWPEGSFTIKIAEVSGD